MSEKDTHEHNYEVHSVYWGCKADTMEGIAMIMYRCNSCERFTYSLLDEVSSDE